MAPSIGTTLITSSGARSPKQRNQMINEYIPFNKLCAYMHEQFGAKITCKQETELRQMLFAGYQQEVDQYLYENSQLDKKNERLLKQYWRLRVKYTQLERQLKPRKKNSKA